MGGGGGGGGAEGYLRQVWHRAQVQSLEDVEQAPDDLGVVTRHSRVP